MPGIERFSFSQMFIPSSSIFMIHAQTHFLSGFTIGGYGLGAPQLYSSRDCFGKWKDLTYLNRRFKYVIGNGGLGEMMAVDRIRRGKLVCVISPICLGR